MIKRVFIKTFGCSQNAADSEIIKAYYWEKGYKEVENWRNANEVVINSCVIRESAENRVYGLINNVKKNKPNIKIVLTGCLVGLSKRKKIKGVDLWKKISDFKVVKGPLRDKTGAALVSIMSGCDHSCSYCIVPLARGREISRDFNEILKEIGKVKKEGFKEIILIGQNVNSYGPNRFPQLLDEVAKKGFQKISFISSNPWNFSDELIEVIANNTNIDRLVHLPVQSGDDKILKKMRRGYTVKDYLGLIKKIRKKVRGVKFSTDIIIGFPEEDDKAFQNTVSLCKKVKFEIAYINKYSPRAGTFSAKMYKNDVPIEEKKRRWKILDKLINKK